MNYREFIDIVTRFSKEHKDDGIIVVSVHPREAENMTDGEFGESSVICCTEVELIATMAMLAEQSGIGCTKMGRMLMKIGLDDGASQAVKHIVEGKEKAAIAEMSKEEKADFLIEKLKHNMRKS
jgi:hypothetical protein